MKTITVLVPAKIKIDKNGKCHPDCEYAWRLHDNVVTACEFPFFESVEIKNGNRTAFCRKCEERAKK